MGYTRAQGLSSEEVYSSKTATSTSVYAAAAAVSVLKGSLTCNGCCTLFSSAPDTCFAESAAANTNNKGGELGDDWLDEDDVDDVDATNSSSLSSRNR